MWIKKYLTLCACASACILSAQAPLGNLKPMTEAEIRNYEYLANNGLLEPKEPRLKREVATKKLETIYKTFVDVQVPRTLDEYVEKKTSQLPTRSMILVHAREFKNLVTNPELPEVTGYSVQWFRKVGNAVVALDGYHTKIMDAVVARYPKGYSEAYHFYRLTVDDLEKLLRNPEKLGAVELRRIKATNTAARKRQYDLLDRRYKNTMRLKEQAERKNRGQQGAGR